MQLSHTAQLVRAHDHDRYLCTLFAPAGLREGWFALFAFNHELASIPEIVSEETIGLMRFAWWRDAIAEIYAGEKVRKHPVAQVLAQAIAAHSLPRTIFDALLDAREARLGAEAFTEAAQWEPYFRATSSGLLELCASVAGEAFNPSLEALGMGWAYIGTARGAALAGEAEDAKALAEAGLAQLDNATSLPACFKPFAAAAEFYAKRVLAGKRTGREAALPLLLSLCTKRMMKKI